MKLQDKLTIQRMLGQIEGVSFGMDDKMAEPLLDAIEIIDGIIRKEEGELCESAD